MSSLINILNNSKLKLPLRYKDGNDYIIDLLEETFKELSIEMLKDEYYSTINDDNYTQINTYCAKIITTISSWFEGNISEAKKNFDETLKARLLILPQKKILSKNCFYRIRTSDEHKILEKKDLFHIPFELRNKISTQRFSIPGFPCLYLGNSVYICWEELNRPKFHDIQVAKFENNTEINLYNLSYEQYNLQKLNAQNPTDGDLINLLLAYPIIAACSIQVPKSRQLDHFKPEYLIPQIVLQTLLEQRDKNTGVVYSSTKIYRENSRNEGTFENFVLPTTSKARSKGFCTDLTTLFNMTSAIAGWPVDFINSYDTTTITPCDFDVRKLDLDGVEIDYASTQFALLEKSLAGKNSTPILKDFIGM